jgi:Carbohydrate family 9 binding domain-like/Carbohydrate binding domain
MTGFKYRLETVDGLIYGGELSSLLTSQLKLKWFELSGPDSYAYYDFAKTKAVLYERRQETKPAGVWIFAYPTALAGSSGLLSKGYMGQVKFSVRTFKSKTPDKKSGLAHINIVKNGSFEECTNPGYPDYWGVGYSNEIKNFNPYCRIDSSQAFDGKNCIHINNTTDGVINYCSVFLSVIPNKKYTFSACIKSARSGQIVNIGSRGLIFTGKKRPAKHYYLKTVKISTRWKRYSLTFSSTATKRIELKLQFKKGNFWFDAVQLEEGNTPSGFISKQQRKISGQHRERKTVPKIDCPLIKAPLIDGKLDDACWKSAVKISPFFLNTPKGIKEPKAITTAWLGRGKDAFYLAFRCNGKNFRGVVKEHDGHIYMDDCIELFISPPGDAKYYHMAYNILDSKYDRLISSRPSGPWNPEGEVKSKLDKNYWTSEVKIPFASFDTRQSNNKVWKMNFCRENHTGNQYSSWSPTFGSFHATERFGKVIFKGPDFSGYHLTVAEVNLEKNSLKEPIYNIRMNISNNSTLMQKLKVKINILPNRGKAIIKKILVDIPANGKKKLLVHGITIAEKAKSCKLKIQIEEKETGTLLKSIVKETVSIPSGARILVEQNFYQNEDMAKIIVFYKYSIELLQKEKPQLKIINESGKTVNSISAIPYASLRNEFKLKIKSLPPGKYRILLCLADGTSLNESFLVKLPQTTLITKINRDKRVVMINGKLDYLRGILIASSSANELISQYKKWFKDAKKRNFNVVQLSVKKPYKMTKITCSSIKKLLDYADSIDLKVIIWFAQKQKKYDHYAIEVNNIIQKFKNHPAILGWQIVDEPAGGGAVSQDDVRKRYKLAKKIDPYHISFMNDVPIGFQKRYAADPETGILPTDCICITYYPIADHHQDSADVSSINNCTILFDEMCRESKKAGQPVWYWNQAFGNRWLWKRTPTPSELVFLIYTPLIHGATGVLHFLYRPQVDAVWEKISELNLELSKISPVLFAETVNDDVIINGRIHGVLRKKNNHYYFISVNTSSNPKSASIDLSKWLGIKSRTVKVLFENRTASIKNGVLNDNYKGYDRHIYEISE